MRSDPLRNLLGAAFFALAAGLAAAAALQHLSLLAWLNAAHNGILAILFARRQPARRYDRTGLWLGILAALLPTSSPVSATPPVLLFPALAGYTLILWSLLTLGPRFGVAPADRGLICRGPYRLLRHPMYLGELLFRLVLVFCSPDRLAALVLALTLGLLQIARIRREEQMIAGYDVYARLVPWRLVPGVW